MASSCPNSYQSLYLFILRDLIHFFSLIFVLSFICTCPLVRGADLSVEKKENKFKGSVLYKISLKDGVERSRVYNYSKKRLKFKTNAFKGRVERYNIFLVLNDNLTGVLAEIVVVKVRKSRKIAYAKGSRSIEGLKLIDLVGRTVIRLDDLSDVIGNLREYRRNPLLSLDLIGRSFILSSANVATGIRLNPQVLSTGFKAEMFLPRSSELSWLNWIGFRYQSEQVIKGNINITTAKSNSVQQVIFSRKINNTEIILRPWFSDWIIYQMYFIYGIKQERNELIEFKVDGTSEDSDNIINMNLSQDAEYFSMGAAINPVHNLYGGVDYKFLSPQPYRVSQSDIEEEKTGMWRESRLGIWVSWIQSINMKLKISLRCEIGLRQDEISDSSEIGSGRNHSISDWERSLLIGLQYAP